MFRAASYIIIKKSTKATIKPQTSLKTAPMTTKEEKSIRFKENDEEVERRVEEKDFKYEMISGQLIDQLDLVLKEELMGLDSPVDKNTLVDQVRTSMIHKMVSMYYQEFQPSCNKNLLLSDK